MSREEAQKHLQLAEERAQELREEGDYEPTIPPDEATVARSIEDAARFISRAAKLIGE